MLRQMLFYILCLLFGETVSASVADTLLVHIYDNPMRHLYQVREKNEASKSQ